jgi:hypothetical protein
MPEDLMTQVQRLTLRLEQLLSGQHVRLHVTPLPEHLPPACMTPRKIGTSIPEIVARAWERQSKISGRDKNDILQDALLATLDPECVDWAVQQMVEEARILWSHIDPAARRPQLPEGEAGE